MASVASVVDKDARMRSPLPHGPHGRRDCAVRPHTRAHAAPSPWPHAPHECRCVACGHGSHLAWPP
eukprot:6590579-Prymnesium_polylepis.1